MGRLDDNKFQKCSERMVQILIFPDDPTRWRDPQPINEKDAVIPAISQATQYGQSSFEGMKATLVGEVVYIFDLVGHWERFNFSARSLALPEVPFEIFQEGLFMVVNENTAVFKDSNIMYIRPSVMNATGILSPGSGKDFRIYFAVSAFNYPKDRSFKSQVVFGRNRVAPNSIGNAKFSGNYGTTIQLEQEINAKGYDKGLYLCVQDVELREFATMNIIIVEKDDGGRLCIKSPKPMSSILSGRTIVAVEKLAQRREIAFVWEDISIEDFSAKVKDGRVVEFGGTGTASGIAPCSVVAFEEISTQYALPGCGSTDSILDMLFGDLQKVYRGEIFPELSTKVPIAVMF